MFESWSRKERFAIKTAGVVALVGIVASVALPHEKHASHSRSHDRVASVPAERPPVSEEVINLQKKLKTAGFYHGSLDGIKGPQTIAALHCYRRAQEARHYSKDTREVLSAMFDGDYNHGGLTPPIERHSIPVDEE